MKEYISKIIEYKNKINILSNQDDIEREMTNLYIYLKQISPNFYKDNKIIPEYRKIIDIVIEIEQELEGLFIKDVTTNYDYYNIPKQTSNEGLLDWIVYMARKNILNKYYGIPDVDLLDSLDLTNECSETSKYIKQLCDSLNIKSEIIEIYPGYLKHAHLCKNSGVHFLNITTLNNDEYLIDCTYSQFFGLRGNNLERIGVLNTSGSRVGKFMEMNNERKDISKTILNKGWIKLDKDVIKHYFDGFTLSFRNGLYYEETKDYSFTTKYTPEDYINFISKKDNQLNYEPHHQLGYQKSPTPNLRF